MGIIIVDLPTGFNHEQKNSNANPGYHREHEKKYFHDVAPQERMIYTTIDCAEDGENGFPTARDLGALRIISPPFVQRALRMQAAVRQVDLVNRHVDVAQRAFDGVHVASLVVIGTNSDVVFGLYNIKQSTHAGAHKACFALSNVKHAYARSVIRSALTAAPECNQSAPCRRQEA